MPPKRSPGKGGPLPRVAGAGGMFPNYGIDLEAITAVPKRAVPAVGATGSRPTNPSTSGRKPVRTPPNKSAKGTGGLAPMGGSFPQYGELDLGVTNSMSPGPLTQGKSKAGIPPPPSHGSRTSNKLKSLNKGTDSPSLKKVPPLPDIRQSKESKNDREHSEEPLTDVEKVLYGDYSSGLPGKTSKTICVFLSSTFSDMKAERNAIWATVYPVLKEYCIKLGFDFSLIDMRWGVLDHATDTHTTEAIVLEEVKRCIDISCGTPFVSLVGQRYGNVINQLTLSTERFDLITEIATKNSLPDLQLLSQWYKLDDNEVPAAYKLQPISSVLPDYKSSDETLRSAASVAWSSIQDRLWHLINDTLTLAKQQGQVQQEAVDVHQKSVTAREVEVGIIDNIKNQKETISIVRKFPGIDQDLKDESSHRYIDVVKSNEDHVKVDEIRAGHIDNFILQPVSQRLQQKQYEISWRKGGIPTDVELQSQEEKDYLLSMCNQLVEEIKVKVAGVTEMPDEIVIKGRNRLVHNAAPDKSEKHVCDQSCMMKCALANQSALVSELKTLADDDLNSISKMSSNDFKEILHHLKFAEVKVDKFCGRKEELKQIKNYFMQNSWASPLMINAEPGSGKTFFLSNLARKVRQPDWLGPRAMVALRFLRTSSSSSEVYSLLKSLCVQISCVYQIHIKLTSTMSMESLSLAFEKLLHQVSFSFGKMNSKCVIILDSIDALTSRNSPFNLLWLPKQLPPNVYIVGSFVDMWGLPGTASARFGMITTLKPMSQPDIIDLFDATLRQANRTLTAQQREMYLKPLSSTSTPLFAKLLAESATQLTSYDPLPDLPATISDAVQQLFTKLELRFGQQFTAFYLSFLTVSFLGITDAEMDDVLSCSDELLVEVYIYHPPPVKGVVRVPPHLAPMIRQAMQEYLAVKNSGDSMAISWYYRQFREAAESRYLSDGRDIKYHKIMVEVFLGESKVRRTITLSKLRTPLTIENAERHVSQVDTETASLRILLSGAHHLAKSQDYEMLMTRCMCKLSYLTRLWLLTNAANVAKFTRKVNNDLPTPEPELEHLASFFSAQCKTLKNICTYPEDERALALASLLAGELAPLDTYRHLKQLAEQACTKLESNAEGKLLLIPSRKPTDQRSGFMLWQSSGVTAIASVVSGEGSVVFRASSKRFEIADVPDLDSVFVELADKCKLVCMSTQHTFFLTDKSVYVRQTDVQYRQDLTPVPTNCFGKGVLFNQAMAVSQNGTLIFLAASDKIAVMEAKVTSGKPKFSPISSLSLSGVKSTDALIMTADNRYTVSAHTIPTKGKSIGGVVKWNFQEKSAESRISLPFPVKQRCLYALPAVDQFLAGCSNNDMYLVSLSEQKILQKPHSGHVWTDISVSEWYLALITSGTVKVCQLDSMKVFTVPSITDPTCVSVHNPSDRIFVGIKSGSISIHTLNDGSLLRSVCVSPASLTQLVMMSSEDLVTLDADRNAAALGITDMINSSNGAKTIIETKPDEEDAIQTSAAGSLSAVGQTLLLRMQDGSLSTLDISIRKAKPIPDSQGSMLGLWCGGEAYVVGQKPNSLLVWDVKNTKAVTIPSILAEHIAHDNSYIHSSQHEPAVLSANKGLVVMWNVQTGEVTSASYQGSSVSGLYVSRPSLAVISSAGTLSTTKGENESLNISLVDRKSLEVVANSQSNTQISKLACGDNCCLYVIAGSCHALVKGTPAPVKLELKHVKDVAFQNSSRFYILHGAFNVSIVDAVSLDVIATTKLSVRINQLMYSDEDYCLVSVSQGLLQLIKWQEAQAVISNPISALYLTISSLAFNKQEQRLWYYGNYMSESFLADIKVILPKTA